MEAVSTGPKASPLAELLRARVARVLAGWEAGGAAPGAEPGRWALRRFLDALDELSEAADALAALQREPPSKDYARSRVLLATDDARLADELQHMLKADLRVEVAPTTNLALRCATARTPAVLFSSGANALECARRVRELLPGLPAVIGAAEPDLPRLVAELGSDPAVLVPTTVGTAGLAMAIRALLPIRPAAARPAAEPTVEPRSYAHLAGLLPRALARTIEFDVGAAVIARLAAEPLVDVHATLDCGEAALESVRERALALFRMVSGRPQKEDEAAQPPAPPPFRSSIYVPLATEGRVVGLTYLASFRPDAFSEHDERVLADLAAHASGAYRQLEASVLRLRLTPRQSQVLALIASGLSDKEVATRLGLAHRTVRTHVDRLLREHGLHSRTEAVAAWLRGKQG